MQEAQVLVLDGPDGKDLGGVDAGAHDPQPHLVRVRGRGRGRGRSRGRVRGRNRVRVRVRVRVRTSESFVTRMGCSSEI